MAFWFLACFGLTVGAETANRVLPPSGITRAMVGVYMPSSGDFDPSLLFSVCSIPLQPKKKPPLAYKGDSFPLVPFLVSQMLL